MAIAGTFSYCAEQITRQPVIPSQSTSTFMSTTVGKGGHFDGSGFRVTCWYSQLSGAKVLSFICMVRSSRGRA